MVMTLVLVLIYAVSILFGSIELRPDELRMAELERRAKHSEAFSLRLVRAQQLTSLLALTRFGMWLFLVLFIVLATVWWGWLGGLLVSLLAVLLFPIATRVPVFSQLSTKLYRRIEPQILDFIRKTGPFWAFLQGRIPDSIGGERHLASREDLTETIDAARNLLDADERLLLVNGIQFRDKTVSEIMTPQSVIQSVKRDEFIGPLVLNELHKLGHSRIPVIDGTIDQVIGILHLRTLLSLDVKKSAAAEELMEPKVLYIYEGDSLRKALKQFVKQRHHLFIVVNKRRETVGLLTLEDVFEALIGRNIVDEDDVHEDMRVAADEQAVKNNNSPNGVYL